MPQRHIVHLRTYRAGNPKVVSRCFSIEFNVLIYGGSTLGFLRSFLMQQLEHKHRKHKHRKTKHTKHKLMKKQGKDLRNTAKGFEELNWIALTDGTMEPKVP